MSRAPLSLFILNRRSLPSGSPKPYSSTLGLLRRAHSHPFSTSSLTPSPEPGPKPSNLSARLSFVFDQIDAIEKQREQSQKDETLRRIRAWREAKNVRSVQSSVAGESQVESGLSSSSRDGNEIMREEPSGFNDGGELKGDDSVKKLELVHPWVEWIELMERLVQHNYFDHRRKDEEKMVRELGFEEGDVPEERFNFNADFKAVQSACLNFGKDRFDILRSLSRQDIQILVGHGCPSSDRKVTLSAKLLRKHVHLDEGDVCSSCSLRSSCEKAYLLTNKEDEARTVDVMRVLSTFGLDHAHGLVTNKSLLKQKSVKTVIRKLLHEIVKLSAVPIDPNLPPPIIKRPPPKVKQPPPPPKKRVGRDDIEMKKGDWLCPKCDFMNFAKNTVCLQCDAKRPKRQLLPGEWECPECNFLNYRRNMVCFHCECKRPPDQFMEDKLEERHQNSRTRLEKKASRPEVSNAWNFDFDDDESDGADVAAFEYADSAAKGEDFPLNSWDQSKSQGHEDGFQRGTKFPRVSGREYPDSEKSSRIGFDDFDDEEDDVNSYELDTGNSHSARSGPFRDFSEMDGDSDYDNGDSNNEPLSRHNARSRSLERPPSKSPHRAHALPRSDGDEMGFDSDNESLVHPNWRSSHVADSRHTGKARTAPGKFRGLSYGSDEEIDLSSDSDDYSREDFGKKKSRGNKISGKGRRQRKSLLYTSESDDDVSSRETQFRRNRVDSKRRESKFGGRNSRSNWNSSLDDDDFHRPLRGARGNYDGRGPRSDVSTGKRVDRRGNGSRKYKGENFENRKWERRNRYEDDRGNDSDDFRNRRRIIER